MTGLTLLVASALSPAATAARSSVICPVARPGRHRSPRPPTPTSSPVSDELQEYTRPAGPIPTGTTS